MRTGALTSGSTVMINAQVTFSRLNDRARIHRINHHSTLIGLISNIHHPDIFIRTAIGTTS
ncbi:uncharacterized protein METZ01_LOCUS246211, partial [marine metagenome]